MSKNDGGPAFPIWQENMSLGDDAGGHSATPTPLLKKRENG